MTIAAIFFTSWVVGLSGALFPGPLFTLGVSESARRGFWTGPLLTLGHAVAEAGVVAALALGLSQVLGMGRVTGTIGLVGGLFLIVLGVNMARGARRSSLSLEVADPPRRAPAAPVVAGLLASLLNPYWVLWWATIGASYILWALGQGALGLAAFFGGHILADLGWLSLVSLVVVSGRRRFPQGVYRGTILGCGLFLILLGVYFLWSGAQMWR